MLPRDEGLPPLARVRRTLPVCLGVVTSLLVLAAVPATRQWILAWDVRCAYWMNGLLGHYRLFDVFVARLNGKAGDAVVVLCLSLVGLAQVCIPWNRQDVCQKLAFWGWVGLAFCIAYVLQELAEHVCRRESPGGVLENWFNLTTRYHIATRVRDTKCFPSGHALGYFFFALVAFRRYRRRGLFFMILGVLMMATRMTTGAHWFSDIYLSSLPIAALAAALAYETPVLRVNRWLEFALSGC